MGLLVQLKVQPTSAQSHPNFLYTRMSKNMMSSYEQHHVVWLYAGDYIFDNGKEEDFSY